MKKTPVKASVSKIKAPCPAKMESNHRAAIKIEKLNRSWAQEPLGTKPEGCYRHGNSVLTSASLEGGAG